MAIRPILKLGHPLLRKKCRKVESGEIQSPYIKELFNDLIETMNASQGLGIAAPQVGENVQVCIIEVPESSERYPEAEGTKVTYKLINPKVEVLDPTLVGFWEGCLSVPDLRGYVERPCKISVEFTDENSQAQQLILEGILAVVFQHEIDHLNGILYVDKILDKEKFSFCDEYEKYWNN